MPKTTKPLELSTAHLAQSTWAWLDRGSANLPLPIRGHEYGWIIDTALIAQAKDLEREAGDQGCLPPDLELCLRWGLARGASKVLFDSDADLRTYLPAYEKDGTICRGELMGEPTYKGPGRWLSGIPRRAAVTWVGSPRFGWPKDHAGMEGVALAEVKEAGLRPRKR